MARPRGQTDNPTGQLLYKPLGALVGALLALFAIGVAQAQTTDRPDLVIDEMLVEQQQAGGCNTSQSALGVRVVVRNIGRAAAGSFAVDLNGSRQRVNGLGVDQNAELWYRNFSRGLNTAVADPQLEVLESSEGNNQRSEQFADIPAEATCTPTPTATATVTLTPTVTMTGTATPIFTVTPAPTATSTFTPAPTSTPAGGVRVVVSPKSVRLIPGQTALIQIVVEWNPAGLKVELSHAAADAVSSAISGNAVWSPSQEIVGTGVTQIVLGTPSTLSPGIYTLNITAKTSAGSSVQQVRFEVLPSSIQFEAEIERRGEYTVLGPEVISPYRGGDGFFYQSRVNALLQWRPDEGTYFHTNTSELLDVSAMAPAQHRLPPTVLDDESSGEWDAAVETRFGWMTDPAIRNRYFQAPPGVTGPWDQNGSIVLYGLPSSLPTQLGPYVVQRFQRAVIRHWIGDVPSHPEWRDTVALVPLHQAVLNFIPEIDPVAAAQIVRASRPNGRPVFGGWWEVDAAGGNGFASVALEYEDAETARVALANPTGLWLEVSLVGPVGTQAELAPGQSVASDWPGTTPLSWILEPGERIVVHMHPNQVHPDESVRSSSVMHLWVRPTSRAAMARVIQGLASVGVPELGDLHGGRLSAFYRAMLGSAQRAGSGRVGCLIALDGDVSAGDERAFAQNLACAAREPLTGWIMADAASVMGVGVDPGVVSGRLEPNAVRARIGPDPAVGWFLWNLQLDGREPGGRVRVSRTGATAGG
jgi:hypothetical protein